MPDSDRKICNDNGTENAARYLLVVSVRIKYYF